VNTDDGTLGNYSGVANRQELASRSIWEGTPVPTFGNAYVRHSPMLRNYPSEEAVDAVIANIVQRATELSTELANAGDEVIVHPIP